METPNAGNDAFLFERKGGNGIIRKRRDGILTLEPYPDLYQPTVETLKKDLEVYLEIQQGQLSPLLSDNRNMRGFGPAERRFVRKTMHQFTNAVAILATDPLPRFFFNIYNYLYPNKPRLPQKLFSNEEEALEWLKTYLPNNPQ